MEPASILVVDDEPALRRFMQMYLERIGYRVETSEDAEQGLTLFGSKPGVFRVVIADLTLPGMKGDKMALEMVSTDPGCRVLLCSGYPYALESLPCERRCSFAILQKPFLPNQLAEAVQELLSR